MANTNTNLRKAAVLIRSLDADSAATMLAQLSTDEAAKIRQAIRALGPIDADEQAEVLDDFRRARPQSFNEDNGVELALSESFSHGHTNRDQRSSAFANRFEFLQNAPTNALVPYLAREHAQTIAVILSHLAPTRAAEVLAALPAKLQADTMERLSGLGETDPASLTVLEQELAAWLAKRGDRRTERARGGDMVATILAAADAKTRHGIISNLKTQKADLAEQIAPTGNAIGKQSVRSNNSENPISRSKKEHFSLRPQPTTHRSSPQPVRPGLRPTPTVDFDQLIHLDNRTLATVLREVDANVLALALVGSRDELVDRICDQMPKRIARTFRRELRRIGPTRLSDVEAAQRAVAMVAAQQIANWRRSPASVSC